MKKDRSYFTTGSFLLVSLVSTRCTGVVSGQAPLGPLPNLNVATLTFLPEKHKAGDEVAFVLNIVGMAPHTAEGPINGHPAPFVVNCFLTTRFGPGQSQFLLLADLWRQP